MTTLPSSDLQAQEPDESAALQDQRQSLASSARALIGKVQDIASRDSRSLQAIWQEHIEALVNLVCFAECHDLQGNRDRSRVSLQELRSFGTLLRDRRSAAGLSRIALAQRAKISDATVKLVETARHPPSRATLIRLLAVPELKLTWEHVPGKLAAAPRAALEVESDTDQSVTEPWGFNCYVTPMVDPVQMVVELGHFLNGAGGLIDPASVYLEHQSAADYLAVCLQHGGILEHRRRLPLAAIAKRIVGATGRTGLSFVALGSGDAQVEVWLAQQLLEEQPKPDLHLWLVDISQPLLGVGLKHAIESLCWRPGVKVTGIQGNFHHLPMFGALGALADDPNAQPRRRARVYSMLGGALDGLDHELRFAEHAIDAKPGDWLVLDVQPAYGPPNDPELIRRKDPALRSSLPRAYAKWLSGPIYRHCKDVRSVEFSLGLDTHTIIPGSYGVDTIANVQAGERAVNRQFVMFRRKRYDVTQFAHSLARIGWAPIATLPCGAPASQPAVAMLFRKCAMTEVAGAVGSQVTSPASQSTQRLACSTLEPSPARDTSTCTMETGQPNFTPRQLERFSRRATDRLSPRTASSALLLGILLLLGLLVSSPVFGQTAPIPAPAPRSINPTLSLTGGSCGTLFAPCPAISRLGLFIWLSGQYLGTGLGGNSHASTLGGSIDVTMEVANRVAVSASIPGSLTRIQGQYDEEVWGIGGPLEARARVRLGPASPGFYSVNARPLWSSVIEVRTQFLIPGFDGDTKYVGRVQRGFVQPALYGAGELNVWRFQFAPGAGILVGDREAHIDLSLRASVQLLDRLFGDVEALRRQALAVPSEPGRCQSAWMGAAGVRFQIRRGMFLSARYVGGQGDCVPQHSFMLNLGLAFGEEHMRIPTPDEVGFIRRWHATLMGMVDPVLDCQGIMRADDGTPMFRFGYPDPHDPSIIRRNHVAYRVGEHFWEKGGHLYQDTDLTHPVLDLYGEAPLTFVERAAMHDCPTLPGLGSPCQVALNLPALRKRIEGGGSPVQVAMSEDAQILACLNHLSPLKAAAVFTSIQAALGPLLTKLPQVARWGNPATPPASAPGTPAAIAAAPPHTDPPPSGGPPKLAASTHPSDHQGPQPRTPGRPGHPQRRDQSDDPPSDLPHLPVLPRWPGRGSSRAVAGNSSQPATHAERDSKPRSAVPSSSTQRPAQNLPPPAVAQNDLPPKSQAPQVKSQKSPQPARGAAEPVAAAPAAGERGGHEPAPSAPLCGTYCKLTLGAVATGVAVVGGEVAKDGIIVGAAAAGGSTGMSAAGVAGSAVAGNIAMHEVADHVKPPNAPTDPAQPASSEQPANSADTANGATTETTDQPAPTQGEVKGDLARLQKEASTKSAGNRVGAKGELDAIERLTKEGKNVDKLPDRAVQGQKEPDFRVDGELYEIKTREEPLDDRWLKDRIRDANKQFKGSNYENPRGSVELQLKNQVESDTQLLERAERQVRGQFKHDRSEHVTDVRVYNDGRLIGEWSRTGDKVVRTFPVAEK